MKQTEEQQEGLVIDVVFDVYAEEQLSTRLYLSGYLYSQLRTAIRAVPNLISTTGKSFEEACQRLMVPEKFQEKLRALLNQESEIIWTEELVKEYIACADLPMEQIYEKARQASTRAFRKVFGEQGAVPGDREIRKEK